MVAPSLREPFGNAVVEAQLSLRPVVATAALGHLESITDEDTGLLVPAEDVDAMAKAIARIIDDPELADGHRRSGPSRSDCPFLHRPLRGAGRRTGQISGPTGKTSGVRTVRILGTHGVPANYGGFETAAEQVGLYLKNQGWRVVVYCQVEGTGPVVTDTWNGLERVSIPIDRDGWLGTSQFDLVSIRHAIKHRDICLTFGYNTAVFNILQRIKAIPNVINMDGIEWSRARWGPARQAILYVNERIACLVGNELIADHPVIETYLRTRAPARKITTITYGAHAVTRHPPRSSRRTGSPPVAISA